MKFLATLSILFLYVPLTAAQALISSDDRKILADFESRARKYSELREKISGQLPALSKDATPEQISASKTALLSRLLQARVNARQGSLFTQSAEQLIRSMIKAEFKGYEAAEIRKTVWEIDPEGIVTRVNLTYPVTKEIVEMSPALLLILPQLPKHLKYRYIGRKLAIIDRDTALIIDFMRNALP